MSIFEKKDHEDSNTIDDMSYIAELHHSEGAWHQYDILLASQAYGWTYMLDSAEYVVRTELDQIGTVSVSSVFGAESTELIHEFNSVGGSIKAMKSLSEEMGALGIGGVSKAIGLPVMIVWINQTNVLT